MAPAERNCFTQTLESGRLYETLALSKELDRTSVRWSGCPTGTRLRFHGVPPRKLALSANLATGLTGFLQRCMLETSAIPRCAFSSAVLLRLVIVFLPAALLTGGGILVLFDRDRANEQALYQQAGSHLVGLHTDIIARELRVVESDLLYLASQAALRHYLANVSGSQEELQQE